MVLTTTLCLPNFSLLLPRANEFFNQHPTPPVEQQAFKPKLTPFTNSGNALLATYSPDGKWIAHVEEEFGKQSVVVGSAEARDIRAIVLPPQEVRYLGLTFSADNSSLYLVRKEKTGRSILYRVPFPPVPSVC